MSNELRVIISGGGTGGHIFPAVSIANAIKALCPDAKILFVGAQGRMEMQRVPAAGYDIEGLPIRGFLRPLWKLGNIGVAIDYLRSKHMAKKLLRQFQPQVAVGVGGYASSAALGAANALGIPTLLQEQNSYAGLANKTLAKHAAKICVAYEGMERFFPAEKIMLTGNPVRQQLLDTAVTHEEAVKTFGLDPQKKTILLVGGSLGARTINESVLQHLDLIRQNPDVQFIWQTGKYYSAEIAERLKDSKPDNLVTSLSVVPEREASVSSVCWVYLLFWYLLPTLQRIIRQRMQWLLSTSRQLFMSRIVRPTNCCCRWLLIPSRT